MNGSICWIPSHVGIDGNEKADELAKDALENTWTLENKIRIVDAGALMRKEMKEKHQAFFTQSETGEKFKRLQPQITDKPWFHQSGINGEEVKVINRLISNHCYDKRWLFRFGKVSSDQCEDCNETETAEHSTFKCKKFTDSRRTFTHLTKFDSLNELWTSKERDLIMQDVVVFTKTNNIDF
jgi:hypothetical protein